MNNENLRGYNDVIILSILYSADSYGYKISKEIAEKSGFKYIIKEATLYSALNRLEKLGFITSYSGSESNGGRRTNFKITETGAEYFLNKKRDFIETAEIINGFIGGAENG